jgi:hypothetical protein
MRGGYYGVVLTIALVFAQGQLATSAPRENPAATVKVEDTTLYIPEGYIDRTDGYQSKFGYVTMRALLPCLLPETPENMAEFHKNNFGNTVLIRIGAWDVNQLTGTRLLAARMAANKSFTASSNDSISDDDHGSVIPGSDFSIYKDRLGMSDIYLKKGSDPLFMLSCYRSNNFPFPSCSSREVINGSLLLEYRYNRSIIDKSLGEISTIDTKIRALIVWFLDPKAEPHGSNTGVCK